MFVFQDPQDHHLLLTGPKPVVNHTYSFFKLTLHCIHNLHYKFSLKKWLHHLKQIEHLTK